MTQNWSFGGGPPTADAPVTVIDGSTFCSSTDAGDIRPGTVDGLYVRDTRVLSEWRLEVDGHAVQSLAVTTPDPFSATHVCRTPPPPGRADSTLLVQRTRYVGDGMREDLLLENLTSAPVRCAVEVHVGADFADLFEVKENRPPDHGTQIVVSAGPDRLDYLLRWDGRSRGVAVRGVPAPRTEPGRLCWTVDLAPRGRWTATLEVLASIGGRDLAPRHPGGQSAAESAPARTAEQWRRRAPAVSGGDPALMATLQRCVEDLGVLRIFDPEHPERAVVAAGAPWFMALFGRDSLLTGWMALPMSPGLALGTLQTLARFQGEKVDPRTEEQPGRILHEVRFGLRSELALGGGSVYYGTADATPLFVMLLGELSRWGTPWAEIEPLLVHADRALAWIEEYGDVDGDGFVEYRRATEDGLANQGWKDSWDGVSDADGTLATAPVALCEVQGYVYGAYRARAHLASRAGDPDGARRWSARADDLRARFDEAFWCPDRGWYAMALDGDKRRLDALASNMGHCLWTGIVPPERAAAVAAHLLSPAMFTGWGVRTLASSMGAYNPMSYHNGSVWPHDSAIVAAGLMRYGLVEQAHRVCTGLLEAAAVWRGRMPELFCGFERERFAEPVRYPASCSPQAWSAAAPLLLLRAMLRLEPSLPDGELGLDPAVPASLLPLRIDRLPLGDDLVTIDVRADSWSVQGLSPGVRLTTPPPAPGTPPGTAPGTAPGAARG